MKSGQFEETFPYFKNKLSPLFQLKPQPHFFMAALSICRKQDRDSRPQVMVNCLDDLRKSVTASKGMRGQAKHDAPDLHLQIYKVKTLTSNATKMEIEEPIHVKPFKVFYS